MARSYLILILIMVIIDAQKIRGQYDFFRLVTFWGPSYCRLYHCLRTPPVPKFTLHGLWPDNYTRNLYNCPGTGYIPLQDQRSISKRDNYWYDYFLPNRPSLRGRWRTQQKFWNKEWNSHGKCSENMFDQRDYFNLAERLMFTHDLKSIIFDPKRQINIAWPRVSDVMSAISKYTGAKPELRCRYYNNGQMLVEVALCYDALGKQVINCPPPNSRFCGSRSSKIYLPRTFKIVTL